jgi:hypothetical protein
MAIRKTGAVTGQVTEVEQAPGTPQAPGERVTLPAALASAKRVYGREEWAVTDEAALFAENEAADGE